MTLVFYPNFLLTMPGGSEWLLILLVVLLFFGGKKIPDLMRGIGKGVREFNDAKETVKNEIDAGMRAKDMVPPTENKSAVQKTASEAVKAEEIR